MLIGNKKNSILVAIIAVAFLSSCSSFKQTSENSSDKTEISQTSDANLNAVIITDDDSSKAEQEYDLGKLYDVTDQYINLSSCVEYDDGLIVLYNEDNHTKLGLFNDTENKITKSVDATGNVIALNSDGKIELIDQGRFGFIQSISIYNQNLNICDGITFPDDNDMKSVCLSYDYREIYYVKPLEENNQFSDVIYYSDFEMKNPSEIVRFNNNVHGKDNPFSIEVVASLNNDELFCTGSYTQDGSDDGVPCSGILNVKSGKYTNIVSEKKYNYQTFTGGVLIFDVGIDYNMTSSGKALIYRNGNKEEITFETPNESQRMMISQNGKYIITNRTDYNGDIAKLTKLRIYETENKKLIASVEMDESKFSFLNVIYINEGSRYALIRAYDKNDKSYIFKVSF